MENKSLYIESIDGNLELKTTEKNLLEYPRGLSALVKNGEVTLFHCYTKNIYDIKVKGSKKIYKVGFYDIVASGNKNDPKKKRIQIPVWKHDIDLSDLICVGIYYYKPNVYVYFKNNEFIRNKRDNINSLWMTLEPFVYAQRNQIDFKYYPKFNINVMSDRRQSEFIVFNNFVDLINYIDNPYQIKEISCLDKEISEIKNEISLFSHDLLEKNEINSSNKDIEIDGKDIVELTMLNSSRFKKLQDQINIYKSNNYMIKSHKVLDINYIKAEQLIYEMLLNDEEFRSIFKNKVNEKNITNVDWKNQDKESYLPYDILVNDNVYIDVKATWKFKNETFYVSENELNFRKNLLNNGLKYLIILVSNLKETNQFKIEILDDKDIEKLDKKLQIIYIIKLFGGIIVSN